MTPLAKKQKALTKRKERYAADGGNSRRITHQRGDDTGCRSHLRPKNQRGDAYVAMRWRSGRVADIDEHWRTDRHIEPAATSVEPVRPGSIKIRFAFLQLKAAGISNALRYECDDTVP
jgi:hypothetical protein